MPSAGSSLYASCLFSWWKQVQWKRLAGCGSNRRSCYSRGRCCFNAKQQALVLLFRGLNGLVYGLRYIGIGRRLIPFTVNRFNDINRFPPFDFVGFYFYQAGNTIVNTLWCRTAIILLDKFTLGMSFLLSF